MYIRLKNHEDKANEISTGFLESMSKDTDKEAVVALHYLGTIVTTFLPHIGKHSVVQFSIVHPPYWRT